MPHEVVLGAVYAAMKALLVADTSLTALLATRVIGGAPAVYDDGEVAVQGAVLPYLIIGAGTQVPAHTMGPGGRYGWNCTVMVKAVSKGTEAAGLAIVSQVAQVLYDGRDLNLTGYGSSWCEEFTVQPTLIEPIAGAWIRSTPAIIRCQMHD